MPELTPIGKSVRAEAGPIRPLLVDERTAARMLGVSPRTVWDLAHRGELRRVLIGRAVRYRVSDLHEFCARQARASVAPAQPG
jgi:excisionase family DNA binding protein